MVVTTENTHTSLGELAVGVDGTPESFAALQWAMRESNITRQMVHAIYGWTHSWDLGDEPTSPDEWERVRKLINVELEQWADTASEGLDFDRSRLRLTSVHSAGSTALLDIGQRAHQIVVGRRTMNAVARWFFGSMSENLVSQASVPVTVVRPSGIESFDTPQDERDAREKMLNRVAEGTAASVNEENLLGNDHALPIIVGVDGSQVSLRALDFAIEAARLENRELHIFYFWQLKSLATIMEREDAIPSIEEGRDFAEKTLDSIVKQAQIPQGMVVKKHVVHASAAKGLLEASRFAKRIIVGSRGLGKFDQHVLGSVSHQLLEKSLTTVTIVH
ncbi:universal stress protein [Alloscardovia venturai]|uniref:Universal stress protein n=1 Tax=Alloscardovia venturai TaxID=1769421 RepID=A0ABW2Y7P4_9BIFI